MRERVTRLAGVATAALIAMAGLAACNSASTIAGQTTSLPSSATHAPKPSHSPKVTPISPESPVPAESNPPGDIPDSTQFVSYTSKAGGFSIKTPEGWARTTTANSVTFTDKLNTIVVGWAPASTAPTVKTATSTEVPQLRASVRAFRLVGVKSSPLPAGPTVLLSYEANSDPNPVTGKQYRQDVLRYELFRNGTQAVITLLSPVGADNVDPWRIVTESFSWS